MIQQPRRNVLAIGSSRRRIANRRWRRRGGLDPPLSPIEVVQARLYRGMHAGSSSLRTMSSSSSFTSLPLSPSSDVSSNAGSAGTPSGPGRCRGRSCGPGGADVAPCGPALRRPPHQNIMPSTAPPSDPLASPPTATWWAPRCALCSAREFLRRQYHSRHRNYRLA